MIIIRALHPCVLIKSAVIVLGIKLEIKMIVGIVETAIIASGLHETRMDEVVTVTEMDPCRDVAVAARNAGVVELDQDLSNITKVQEKAGTIVTVAT